MKIKEDKNSIRKMYIRFFHIFLILNLIFRFLFETFFWEIYNSEQFELHIATHYNDLFLTNQKAAKMPVLEKNLHRHSISWGRFRVMGFLIFSFGSELTNALLEIQA